MSNEQPDSHDSIAHLKKKDQIMESDERLRKEEID